jgi:hypothetical protein
VVEPVFLQPAFVLAFKHFPLIAAHSVGHLHNAGLKRIAAVFELRVIVHHIEAGAAILFHERQRISPLRRRRLWPTM